ncbi:MAG: hypothetical protein EZS28_020778 [Streblomastix strix]|uniref:Uncharacterized protein n=1 Tax=Streblomastix strix TaxID=222440 RepID=A0A5J4VN56_9EUKA|nr:MAG: hypothetical protein EZS28_020778 [Streblomastix strix]
MVKQRFFFKPESFPKVKPAFSEKKRGLIWITLEFAVGINQRIASMIEDIARNSTSNLMGKIFKVWEAQSVSVNDAQTDHESRLKSIYTGAQSEEVFSKSLEERFKRKKIEKSVVILINGRGRGRFNRLNSGVFKGIQDCQRVTDSKERRKFGRRIQERDFDSIQTNSNQEEKFSS